MNVGLWSALSVSYLLVLGVNHVLTVPIAGESPKAALDAALEKGCDFSTFDFLSIRLHRRALLAALVYFVTTAIAEYHGNACCSGLRAFLFNALTLPQGCA